MFGGALVFSALSAASEGMWQPHQLSSLEFSLKVPGQQAQVTNMTRVVSSSAAAVVSLGDCTGSFVSDKGLILTSHHCAYQSIRHNSKAGNNLLSKGFLARYFSEELPAAPDVRVLITEQVTDVSRQILRPKADMPTDARARYEYIEQQQKMLIAECEEDASYRCTVYVSHSGLEYHLVKQLEIRDVRLVYVPMLSVGQFGGDIDNGRWPRHAGDFAFYRAYVGPDGKPADYATDNKPYTPDTFLKVSVKGVNEGEGVIALGYPQQTDRYRSAGELQNKLTRLYPLSRAYQNEIISIIRNVAANNSDVSAKYENLLESLNSSNRKIDRMMQGYQRSQTQRYKDMAEQELINWINADKGRWQKYEPAMQQLDELLVQQQQYQQRELILQFLNMAQLPAMAKQLYRLAHERQKPDAEREAGFQQRDIQRIKASLQQLNQKMDLRVDLELALNFLKHYAQLPAEQRLPELDRFFIISDGVNQEIVRHKLEAMYRRTALHDETERLAWMDRTPEEFMQSDDPMIAYAVALYQSNLQQEQLRKTAEGQMLTVRPLLMQSLIAFNNARKKSMYADANGTLRIAYGVVKGYQPKDAVWYQPVTTAPGLLAKVTDLPPFNAPSAQTDALKRAEFGRYLHSGLKTLPVNFLSTADVTDGNSGSPTLNRRAELIGLLFDRVSESTISDWYYDDNLSRAIHVDSRYILWQMEQVDGAFNLLAEMAIVY